MSGEYKMSVLSKKVQESSQTGSSKRAKTRPEQSEADQRMAGQGMKVWCVHVVWTSGARKKCSNRLEGAHLGEERGCRVKGPIRAGLGLEVVIEGLDDAVVQQSALRRDGGKLQGLELQEDRQHLGVRGGALGGHQVMAEGSGSIEDGCGHGIHGAGGMWFGHG
jgi:hypothetical protein